MPFRQDTVAQYLCRSSSTVGKGKGKPDTGGYRQLRILTQRSFLLPFTHTAVCGHIHSDLQVDHTQWRRKAQAHSGRHKCAWACFLIPRGVDLKGPAGKSPPLSPTLASASPPLGIRMSRCGWGAGSGRRARGQNGPSVVFLNPLRYPRRREHSWRYCPPTPGA